MGKSSTPVRAAACATCEAVTGRRHLQVAGDPSQLSSLSMWIWMSSACTLASDPGDGVRCPRERTQGRVVGLEFWHCSWKAAACKEVEERQQGSEETVSAPRTVEGEKGTGRELTRGSAWGRLDFCCSSVAQSCPTLETP